MWRSTVDDPAPRPPRVSPPAGHVGPRSDLDVAGDPLDREGPAGRRVDVDLGRVEDDRARRPTSNRVGSALMNRGRTVFGSKPITLQTGPVIPRSVW